MKKNKPNQNKTKIPHHSFKTPRICWQFPEPCIIGLPTLYISLENSKCVSSTSKSDHGTPQFDQKFQIAPKTKQDGQCLIKNPHPNRQYQQT